MLTQNYAYYLWKIFSAGMLSPAGLFSLLLLLVAVVLLFTLDRSKRIRHVAAALLLVAAIGACASAFTGAVYTFEEDPDSLDIPALAGEPTCGTAWTGWIRSGYGIGNPCQRGCFRGKVVNKQMRMRGLPPWPEYRRELQCWVRDGDPRQ